LDNNHAHATKTSIRGLKSTLPTDSALSVNFNINELESALKSVKPETAAGFGGVYPESTRNGGERKKEGMRTLFKRAKIIAFPKPGKDGSDPAYYRLISLLSVLYK
jgi:hypothetical protein